MSTRVHRDPVTGCPGLPRTNPSHSPGCGDAWPAGNAVLTNGQAMEATVEQCQQRGLTDTATWLSELLLAATPRLREGKLSRASGLLTALIARDAAWDAVRVGPPCAPSAPPPPEASGRPEEAAAAASQAMAGAARWRVYHRMALGLFHKAEYQRCHHYLMKAMQEADEEFVCKKRDRVVAGMEEPQGPSGERWAGGEGGGTARRRPSPAPPTTSRMEGEGGDGVAACVAASFATTRLPPSLVFLCLYAFYKEGQKVNATSANPRRTKNPNLRVLRVLLLEALRNPSSHLSNAGAALPLGRRGDGAAAANSRAAAPSTSASASGPSPDCHTPASASCHTAPSGKESNSAAAPPLGLAGVRLWDSDPYLTWLAGVVLRDLGLRQESATYFLASARVNPLLWCAWEDMSALVSRETHLEEIAAAMHDVEPTFMLEIFLALGKASLGVAPLMRVAAAPAGMGSPAPPPPSSLEQQRESREQQLRSVNAWEYLLKEYFPHNLYLLGQLANFYYHHHKDLDRAERLYQQIHKADPYRLDFVADYSNLLFMKSDRLALANLAQKVYQAAPFRAESNFVVGNYYVLLGQHDRSVCHFRRAVAIQPTFVAAWTLLGHAYVETRNTTAAVEAYRAAVELDPRDYRCWYNLGQLYELMQAYHHALYYYWHTTSLRPMDPRMWTAVANCLEHEGRLGESITCLERAIAHEPIGSDLYPAIAKRIATYYIDTRYFAKACVYLERLASCRAASQDDLLFALPILVQHHVQQAHQLFGLPARSPSYEPVLVAGTADTPMATPGSSRKHASVHGQPSSPPSQGGVPADPRAESALKLLAAAETHLATLSGLVGGGGAPDAEANTESASESGGGSASATPPRRQPPPPPPSSAMAEQRPASHVEKFIHDMRRKVAENRRLIRLQMRN